MGRRARDGGFSVVEIVMAVSIMAIIIVPVMNAVMATVRASSSTSQRAQMNTILQNAADRVNRAPNDCLDYYEYARAAAQTAGWIHPGAVTVQQSYFEAGDDAISPGEWLGGICPTAGFNDLLVQLVTVTVTAPRGDMQKTIQVVKSKCLGDLCVKP